MALICFNIDAYLHIHIKIYLNTDNQYDFYDNIKKYI